MTQDFIRAPEDKVRLWRVFMRLLGLGLVLVMAILLLLALIAV